MDVGEEDVFTSDGAITSGDCGVDAGGATACLFAGGSSGGGRRVSPAALAAGFFCTGAKKFINVDWLMVSEPQAATKRQRRVVRLLERERKKEKEKEGKREREKERKGKGKKENEQKLDNMGESSGERRQGERASE